MHANAHLIPSLCLVRAESNRIDDNNNDNDNDDDDDLWYQVSSKLHAPQPTRVSPAPESNKEIK